MRSLSSFDSSAANERLFSEREAATLLGISYAMLRILRARMAISHIRIGTRVLYRASHLESFRQSHERRAIAA